MLRARWGPRQISVRNPLKSRKIRPIGKKIADPRFFLLRPRSAIRKYRLTETDGTRKRGSEAEGAAAKIAADTTGDKAAGCAKRLAALRFLCPRSLTLMMNEGICGRFGRIDV